MNLHHDAASVAFRDEVVVGHLLALSLFIEHSEGSVDSYKGLKEALVESLSPDRPFSRWNFFAKPVRTLARGTSPKWRMSDVLVLGGGATILSLHDKSNGIR